MTRAINLGSTRRLHSHIHINKRRNKHKNVSNNIYMYITKVMYKQLFLLPSFDCRVLL